jgi:hypothetical protein
VTTSFGSSRVDALLDLRAETAMPASQSIFRVDQPESRCIVSIARIWVSAARMGARSS